MVTSSATQKRRAHYLTTIKLPVKINPDQILGQGNVQFKDWEFALHKDGNKKYRIVFRAKKMVYVDNGEKLAGTTLNCGLLGVIDVSKWNQLGFEGNEKLTFPEKNSKVLDGLPLYLDANQGFIAPTWAYAVTPSIILTKLYEIGKHLQTRGSAS